MKLLIEDWFIKNDNGRYLRDKLVNKKMAIQVYFLIVSRYTRLIYIKLRAIKGKIYIKGWSGRLGNNLLQITHAIYLADKLHSEIHTSQHQFIDVSKQFNIHNLKASPVIYRNFSNLDILFNDLRLNNEPCLISRQNRKVVIRNFFYQYDNYPFIPRICDYRLILKNQVLPMISPPITSTISNDTLVIHIRSGDIFKDTGVHGLYVQPPLSFYLKIISENYYKNIIIVTQTDNLNPCVEQLKSYIANPTVQSLSLTDDINTILSAKHLVASVSSFSLALGFASKNLKKLYLPLLKIDQRCWRSKFFPKLFQIIFDEKIALDGLDFDVFRYRISDYIAMGNWENSEEQRQLMVAHSQNKVNWIK